MLSHANSCKSCELGNTIGNNNKVDEVRMAYQWILIIIEIFCVCMYHNSGSRSGSPQLTFFVFPVSWSDDKSASVSGGVCTTEEYLFELIGDNVTEQLT